MQDVGVRILCLHRLRFFLSSVSLGIMLIVWGMDSFGSQLPIGSAISAGLRACSLQLQADLTSEVSNAEFRFSGSIASWLQRKQQVSKQSKAKQSNTPA